jgi:hypothetical protein
MYGNVQQFSLCFPLPSEYQLTSADITALHALASPGGLLQGNAPWQQSLSQQQQQQQLSLASLSNLV